MYEINTSNCNNDPGLPSFYKNYGKRLIDIVGSLFALLLLIPVFFVVGILIKIDSPGPVLFKQKRIGQYGYDFNIYKFRSMINNADQLGLTSTRVGDKRITKVGRIIRKLSIDELPQLLNILIGQMSFVGYRPGVRNDYSDIELEKGDLFTVKPGLTGYAQVNGRSYLNVEEKRFWEKKYIQDISLCTDFKIFIKTICVVLKLENII